MWRVCDQVMAVSPIKMPVRRDKAGRPILCQRYLMSIESRESLRPALIPLIALYTAPGPGSIDRH